MRRSNSIKTLILSLFIIAPGAVGAEETHYVLEIGKDRVPGVTEVSGTEGMELEMMTAGNGKPMAAGKLTFQRVVDGNSAYARWVQSFKDKKELKQDLTLWIQDSAGNSLLGLKIKNASIARVGAPHRVGGVLSFKQVEEVEVGYDGIAVQR